MPRRKTATPPETFDEPWKQIVPALFQPFLEFFAPEIAREIDWSRKPVFLDKELRRIAKGFGRRRRSTADFLVKVWRLDGAEQWLIIHIELQAQKDARFAERMFLYNVRAYDLHRKPVISLAVLADNDPQGDLPPSSTGWDRAEPAYATLLSNSWTTRSGRRSWKQIPTRSAWRSSHT